ncbi:hypothetical protein [Actinoplanes derwentensis]|uniref:Uncharacterized protein n=1 Tax=Actinoplanes derwentensis TaxID=113562 RepID=A0A1H2CQB9_9ACTN|nr:hypothetical protein [Actinoplanes derwentensis]GID83857.1 hypothetical protein Ade03nite_27810 [Actinoplanes derwentensis]SDT72519.1 hypothetical protein SAMN04489716_6430 [Actinoplanes derwentensis]
MRTQATYRIGLAVAAGAVIAGCANSAASPAASSAPSPVVPTSTSASPLPTITLTEKPPKEPTDNLPETGWIAGMVTIGGKGPCYGLLADDGQRYALYSTAGTELAKGARVKVQLETTPIRIYCGPGTLMAMTASEPIE